MKENLTEEFDEAEWVCAKDVDEILSEWMILLGSKEARDNWQHKSIEEQEREIKKFNIDLKKIKKLLDQEFQRREVGGS